MPGRILTLASAALVGLGVVLLAFYGVNQVSASRGHQQGLEAFEAAREALRIDMAAADAVPADAATRTAASGNTGSQDIGKRPAEENAEPSSLDVSSPDTALWSEKRISDYEQLQRTANQPDLPEGILRIPSVDLELPLFTGTDEANLTRGAGIIEGTAPIGEVGNTGIAAHRDGYFRALKDVKVGDAITIETLTGVHDYRIDELSIVYPEDIHVLDPTDDSVITLVTCYPFYYAGSAPQRFIVRATER